MVYDFELFINTLTNVLISPKFKMLDLKHVETFIKAFRVIVKNDNTLKLLLSDIMDIQKGVGKDCLIQLEMKIALAEKSKK
jgi:hypothetical protein